MDTIQAIKMVKAIEAALEAYRYSSQAAADRTVDFIERLHKAGFRIEAIPLAQVGYGPQVAAGLGTLLQNAVYEPPIPTPREFQERHAIYATSGTNTSASAPAFQPNREETQEELAQQKHNMGGIF